MLDKLKERWGVQNAWQVIIILIVFALTGTSSLYVKKPIYYLIGIHAESPFWIKTLGFIFIVLPLYQVLLLFYGFLLGQFTFFWEFEKRTWNRMKSLFIKNPKQ